VITKAILPLPTYKRKGRVNLLSMNVYRNLHYFAVNKAKRDYHEVVEEFVKSLPKYKTLVTHYTIYFNNQRKKDVDNYTFPIHKFLMDALVEGGVLEDDNYDYVTGYASKFGGIEEENYVVVELIGEKVETDVDNLV
jgi:Holliday junction resolvase RusA-like endonuclease